MSNKVIHRSIVGVFIMIGIALVKSIFDVPILMQIMNGIKKAFQHGMDQRVMELNAFEWISLNHTKWQDLNNSTDIWIPDVEIPGYAMGSWMQKHVLMSG